MVAVTPAPAALILLTTPVRESIAGSTLMLLALMVNVPAVKRSLDSLGQVLELRDSAAVNDQSRARGRFRWSC